jgi:acyl carrier protein
MIDDDQMIERVCRAVHHASDNRLVPKPSHSLVDDFGFDSLRMASLAIALETEFRQPVLLNDWISMAADPSHLTVRSLADYLRGALGEES